MDAADRHPHTHTHTPYDDPLKPAAEPFSWYAHSTIFLIFSQISTGFLRSRPNGFLRVGIIVWCHRRTFHGTQVYTYMTAPFGAGASVS